MRVEMGHRQRIYHRFFQLFDDIFQATNIYAQLGRCPSNLLSTYLQTRQECPLARPPPLLSDSHTGLGLGPLFDVPWIDFYHPRWHLLSLIRSHFSVCSVAVDLRRP